MFRMIFITLVALFGVLAAFGIDQPRQPQAQFPLPAPEGTGMMASVTGMPLTRAPRHPAATAVPPSGTALFVGPRPAILRITPQTGAEVLHMLTFGAQVRSLGELRDGFLKVQDAQGATGFVPVHLVSAKQPI
ncbi:MAG TPA: SH3 domain-containing protein [Paracoccus sp. (in: a-proteobacteria)]|nr:SH3 domain-containing protein [Paracoccus sp. (in: a-proteobacteria)]